MIRTTFLTAAIVLGLSSSAQAAEAETHITDYDFSFEGWFGTYDQLQLQRGLQIYTEVCAACHGLRYVPIRTLHDESGPGLPEDQVFAYAEEFFVADEASNLDLIDPATGDYRALTPNDNFPVNATQNAPDLSLMAKARAGFHGPYGTGIAQLLNGMGGPEYIASLLAGYEEAPSCAPEDFDGWYNTAFEAGGYPVECIDEDGHHKYPGSWIGMAPPLSDGLIDYEMGDPNDVEALALDVSAFLMWAAEPKLPARKQAGMVGVVFLTLLSVLLYLTNKRIWAPIKKREDETS